MKPRMQVHHLGEVEHPQRAKFGTKGVNVHSDSVKIHICIFSETDLLREGCFVKERFKNSSD
jgi:hypothetical protein